MNYFAHINGIQQGPFPADQLLAKGVRPETLVWTEGMPQWQRADSVPELQALFSNIPQPPPYPGVPYAVAPQYAYPPDSRKIAAGLCGILLGRAGHP